MVEAHVRRVQAGVVSRVGGLVAQQVAVGPGLAQAAEAVASAFAKRKGDGAVGKLAPYRGHDVAHHFVGEPRILAPLQHKGAEPQPVARATAVHNLFLA